MIPGDALHHHVQDHQVHPAGVLVQIAQGLLAAGSLRYLEALSLQKDAQHVPNFLVVVYDQYFIAHICSPAFIRFNKNPARYILQDAKEAGEVPLFFYFRGKVYQFCIKPTSVLLFFQEERQRFYRNSPMMTGVT